MSGTGRINEVQGLRGIAVLAVVLFHARIPGLHGGFLGVDVFFVISGFVISLMLRRDIEAGTFRFSEFYVRRAWRLMPALAATLVMSGLLFGFLLPTALDGILWQSLVAAAFGVSNFYFNGRLDYFDGGLANPALHTWSLGVEEQFYLAFPLLLVLLYRHREKRGLAGGPILVLVTLAVLGFVAAVWQTALKSDVAFYLTWFRAWEFLAGAVVAFAAWRPHRENSVSRRAIFASWLGLILLMASLLFYREQYLFPGLGALVPVLGTALLIGAAGRGGMVNRVLACRPLTLAGDLSYSMYLAHWPVTCAIGLFVPLERLPFAILALSLSLVAGYILWRFVELPLRHGFRGRMFNMPALAVPLVMACVALGSFGVVVLGDTFWRQHPTAVAYFQNGHPTTDVFRRDRCFLTLKATINNFDPAECLPERQGVPALLVLGDSMAANIVMELKRQMPGVDVQQATAVDYKPGLPGPRWPATTVALDKYVHEKLLRENVRKPHILLYARWNAEDLQPLKALVANLVGRGYQVTVMGPSPQFYVALPFLAGYGEILGLNLVPLMSRTDRIELDKSFAAALPNAKYVSVMRILCATEGRAALAENCATRIGGELMFFDALHYTQLGARFVVQRLPLPVWSAR